MESHSTGEKVVLLPTVLPTKARMAEALEGMRHCFRVSIQARGRGLCYRRNRNRRQEKKPGEVLRHSKKNLARKKLFSLVYL